MTLPTTLFALGLFAGTSSLSGCSGQSDKLAPTVTTAEDIKAHQDKMMKRTYGTPDDAPQRGKGKKRR